LDVPKDELVISGSSPSYSDKSKGNLSLRLFLSMDQDISKDVPFFDFVGLDSFGDAYLKCFFMTLIYRSSFALMLLFGFMDFNELIFSSSSVAFVFVGNSDKDRTIIVVVMVFRIIEFATHYLVNLIL